MNISTQRKVDFWLGIIVCWVFSLLPLKPEIRFPQKGIRKVLVILLSEMGSLVLAYPMFRQIERKYPDASTHVLLFEKNREILELTNAVPGENIITIRDTSFLRFCFDSASAVKRIRALHFDAVIDCELFARISSVFSFLSGARIRVGFYRYTQEGLYRGRFLNRRVLYNPYHHISRQFITLLESIETDTVPRGKRLSATDLLDVPRVPLAEQDIQHIRQKIHRDFPSVVDKPLILISPGAGVIPIRAWPIHKYCELSVGLLNRGYAVGIIGVKQDNTLARQIVSHCQDPCCVDLTGYTKSVRELLLLFRLSSFLITNDGGPAQFSAMVPVPAIVFYGPETPILYATLNVNASHFYLSLPCSPCLTAYNHRNTPCDGNNLCLKSISAEEVLAKTIDMLTTMDGGNRA